MSRPSGDKGEPWLAKQIDIARRNLAEWPEWMKQTGRIDAAGKREVSSPASAGSDKALKSHKSK